jgi:hypothetical protein
MRTKSVKFLCNSAGLWYNTSIRNAKGGYNMPNQERLRETKHHGAVRFPFNIYPPTITQEIALALSASSAVSAAAKR